jgi:hypothetical protein
MHVGVFLRWLVVAAIFAILAVAGTLGLIALSLRQVSRWWLRLGTGALLGLLMGTMAFIADPITDDCVEG